MANGRIWTEDEDKLLTRLCAEGKHEYCDMRPFFVNRTASSLSSRAKQGLDIKNQHRWSRYIYDDNFFAEPNLINCWTAGFFSADSCIYKNKRCESYVMSMFLAAKDLCILENVKRWIKYTGPIEYVIKEGHKQVGLRIHGLQQMRRDLANLYGIVERKTHRLPPPKLTELSHKLAFLGGYIDGDGSISHGGGLMTVRITSCSLSILEWALEFMKSLNLPQIKAKPLKVNKRTDTNAYTLSFSGAQAIHFIELMRAQNLPLLARKWDNPALNAAIAAYKARFPAHFGVPVIQSSPISAPLDSSQIVSTPV